MKKGKKGDSLNCAIFLYNRADAAAKPMRVA
jgi:hypothetical protein